MPDILVSSVLVCFHVLSKENCNFVEAPALAPAEVKMDPNLAKENAEALDAANKSAIPDDADEDL